MNRCSNMQERVDAYLTTRRRLGYALHIEGQQLRRFAQFADARGHAGAITTDLALEWACASARSGPIGHARRLDVVRPFAKFCASFEAETQNPPVGALGPAHRRLTPHIYTDAEIGQLLAAAGELIPTRGLRPASMRCLLGLLAATGLRVSEALHLQRDDVDLARGMLCVRQTKFRKSRYVALHPSASTALSEYAAVRNRYLPLPREEVFFLLDHGGPLRYGHALYAFHRIRRQLGWDRPPGRRPRPRLYDLRHTFACRRLLQWYREGRRFDLGRAAVVDLFGTRQGDRHVLVPHRYPGIDGRRRGALRAPGTARRHEYRTASDAATACSISGSEVAPPSVRPGPQRGPAPRSAIRRKHRRKQIGHRRHPQLQAHRSLGGVADQQPFLKQRGGHRAPGPLAVAGERRGLAAPAPRAGRRQAARARLRARAVDPRACPRRAVAPRRRSAAPCCRCTVDRPCSAPGRCRARGKTGRSRRDWR